MGRIGAQIGVAVVALSASWVGAGIITPGTYELLNHPRGYVDPPYYGLRLDGLLTGNKNDVFTFDFEHPESFMTITYDDTDSTVHIQGVAYGGLDIGVIYAPATAGLWAIDAVYNVLNSTPEGLGSAEGGFGPGGFDDDLHSSQDDEVVGSITRLDTGDVFNLWAETGEHGFSFRVGDEDNDLGHRDFPGASGWGWLTHTGPDDYLPHGDWLFAVGQRVVPAPSGAALVALGALACTRRRR